MRSLSGKWFLPTLMELKIQPKILQSKMSWYVKERRWWWLVFSVKPTRSLISHINFLVLRSVLKQEGSWVLYTLYRNRFAQQRQWKHVPVLYYNEWNICQIMHMTLALSLKMNRSCILMLFRDRSPLSVEKLKRDETTSFSIVTVPLSSVTDERLGPNSGQWWCWQ